MYFEQCDPKAGDWIGVYDHDANNHNLGNDGKLWVFTCGNQWCTGLVYAGNVTFDDGYPNESGTDSWPLDRGRYQVHLIRDSWPYR